MSAQSLLLVLVLASPVAGSPSNAADKRSACVGGTTTVSVSIDDVSKTETRAQSVQKVEGKSNAGNGALIGAGLALLTGGASLVIGAAGGALVGHGATGDESRVVEHVISSCRFRVTADGTTLVWSGTTSDGNHDALQKCLLFQKGDKVQVSMVRTCPSGVSYKWTSGAVSGELR